MEIKQFVPDDQFLDNLIASLTGQNINLDMSDVENVKRCKEIHVYEASNDASFEGDSDEFIEKFFGELRNQLYGREADHIVINIACDNSEPITLESMSYIHDFCETFDENTEIRWGMSRNEDKAPMRIVIAVGSQY